MSDYNSTVSLIIPTYNRPTYLKRCLSFYNSQKVKFKIIIADSSFEKFKKINESVIESFSNLDITYVNDFPSDLIISYKISRTMDIVKRKYTVICADDDFIFPDSVKKSVEFLNSNQSFTAVAGYSINFMIKKNKKNQQKFLWQNYNYYLFPYLNITYDDIKLRIEHIFSHYFPTFYYMHRTEFLGMLFKETLKNTDDNRFGELFPAITTAIHGKIKTLNIYSGARESLEVSDNTVSEKLIDFIKKGSYNNKFLKFRKGLVNHVMEITNCDENDAKIQIDQGMESYLKNYIFKKTSPRKFSNYIPTIIKCLINKKNRKDIWRYFLIKREFSLNYLMKMRFWNFTIPSESFYNNLRKIETLLLQFDNKYFN